jgi:hypothetical protein
VPNIKPYPHQDAYVDMSQQQHKQYSIYRPAYHRIPSTPAVAPRNSKEVYASASPEVSPIVVPSMSTATIPSQHLDFYHSAYPNPVQVYYSPIHAAYRHPSIPSLNVGILLLS